MIGVYSERNLTFDVYICAIVLVVGWVLEQLDCSPAPLVLGMILGPIMEENFRRAMLLSRGDPMVFIERPISATMLAIAAIALAAMLLPNIRKGKDTALAEGG